MAVYTDVSESELAAFLTDYAVGDHVSALFGVQEYLSVAQANIQRSDLHQSENSRRQG